MDIGSLLIGIAAVISALTAAAVAFRTTLKVDAVHREVKTINAQTLAQLADASEARRIAGKQDQGEELTDQERSHLASMEQ